ncbi:MAG: hypothetical protein A2150_03665 [Candidatus Muproteobacteria bacterium RBG_16_64_11]|uniref:Uncharacterized protein n=1 Tax=Candidatus Muproteobacteria bacterium RBG_16_64_11 TaxID=1817758 RepID=A0A1F6TC25_9PROT|nr:MAG: hypothetical protein A2150_03665 [Candidatus Muproteobacteria bacterium RBG_16_64_11]
MPNTKYFYELVFPTINDEVRSICHYPFAGTADVTRPTQLGMGQELRSSVPNALRHFLRGDRIFSGDVLLRFDKVR